MELFRPGFRVFPNYDPGTLVRRGNISTTGPDSGSGTEGHIRRGKRGSGKLRPGLPPSRMTSPVFSGAGIIAKYDLCNSRRFPWHCSGPDSAFFTNYDPGTPVRRGNFGTTGLIRAPIQEREITRLWG